MKKFIAIITAALVSTAAFAQVEVGAGYLNASYSGDFENSGSGLYAGVSYNFPFAEVGIGTFGVKPGLYYSYYSAKDTFKTGLASTEFKFKEHSLNVPVRLNYNMGLASDLSIAPYFGPVFAFGVSGDADGSGSVLGVSGSNSRDLYDGLKRFDVKLGLGVDITFLQFFKVNVGYDWGLLNRYDGNGDLKAKVNYVHLGLAYAF